MRAVVARSTSKSKCTKHTILGALLEVEMSKKCAVAAQIRFPSQNVPNTILGALLEVEMLKKCTPLWREAHVQVKSVKKMTVQDHFWTFRCRFVWQGQGILHLTKSEQKRDGFVAVSKTLAGVRLLKKICKDAFRVAGAVQETCSSEMLGGQGADFLRWVAFWCIRSSSLLR